MHYTVAGGILFRIIRDALGIHLDIAVAVIKEDANLPGQDFTTLLYPDQLAVVIDGLHAITAYVDTEVRSRRNVIRIDVGHFKVSLIDVVAGASRSADRRNGHIRVCPLCGETYAESPALSRVDNETPICPDCGTRQALASIGISADEQEKILAILHQSRQ